MPQGGTRLTRTMVRRRHLFPHFYFGPLQQAIIGRGQVRLLDMIRELVEHEGRDRDRGTVALRR